jgi:hypothetical protein
MGKGKGKSVGLHDTKTRRVKVLVCLLLNSEGGGRDWSVSRDGRVNPRKSVTRKLGMGVLFLFLGP